MCDQGQQSVCLFVCAFVVCVCVFVFGTYFDYVLSFKHSIILSRRSGVCPDCKMGMGDVDHSACGDGSNEQLSLSASLSFFTFCFFVTIS